MPIIYRPGFFSAIGYIPFVARWRHLRNTHYPAYVKSCNKPKTMRGLMDGFFKTGNREPPESIFLGPQEFFSYLETREYRGALMLYDLEIEDHGDHLAVRLKHLEPYRQAGYTPVPLPFRTFWVRRWFRGSRGEIAEGRGGHPFLEDLPPREGGRHQRAGSVPNREAISLGYRIPDRPRTALCVDESALRVRPRIEGRQSGVSGTAVPSQQHRWRTRHEGMIRLKKHETLWIGVDAIRGVFECDTHTAPRHFLSAWYAARID